MKKTLEDPFSYVLQSDKSCSLSAYFELFWYSGAFYLTDITFLVYSLSLSLVATNPLFQEIRAKQIAVARLMKCDMLYLTARHELTLLK